MFSSPSWSFSFIHSSIHSFISLSTTLPTFCPTFIFIHLFNFPVQTSPPGSLRQEVLQLQLSAKALKGNSSDPWPQLCVLLKACPEALRTTVHVVNPATTLMSLSLNPLLHLFLARLLINELSQGSRLTLYIGGTGAPSFSFCCTRKVGVFIHFWADWPCIKPFFVLQGDKGKSVLL